MNNFQLKRNVINNTIFMHTLRLLYTTLLNSKSLRTKTFIQHYLLSVFFLFFPVFMCKQTFFLIRSITAYNAKHEFIQSYREIHIELIRCNFNVKSRETDLFCLYKSVLHVTKYFSLKTVIKVSEIF